MTAKARHDLQQVFKAIKARKVWFSAYSRSVWAVIKVYEHRGSPNKKENQAQAEDFILQGICALTEDNFVESVLQWGDSKCVADVYGLIFDGLPWYIKFRIDEEGDLDEISFHPPQRALKTVGGIVIPQGEMENEK